MNKLQTTYATAGHYQYEAYNADLTKRLFVDVCKKVSGSKIRWVLHVELSKERAVISCNTLKEAKAFALAWGGLNK